MSFNPAEPTLQKVWDWRAAGNFIGGGTGTGLLMVTLVAALTGAPMFAPTLTGLICVALGLSMVWLEIGRPLRALHVFFHPQTSWMTREAATSAPLMLAGLLALWLQWIGLMALLAAIAAVFLYCQGRILHAARGIPVWRTPRIVPLILVTGLTEGAALFLMLMPWLAPATFAAGGRTALVLLVALCILRFGAWKSYRAGLEGAAPLAALRALHDADGVVALLGSITPALLAAVGLMFGEYATAFGVAAGVLAAYGGWHMKAVIITRASYNQGFAINQTPARGGGKPGPGTKPGW